MFVIYGHRNFIILILILCVSLLSCATLDDIMIDQINIGDGNLNTNSSSFRLVGTVWSGNALLTNTPVKFEYMKPGASGAMSQTTYTSQVGTYNIVLNYGSYEGEYSYSISNGTMSFSGTTNKGSIVTHNFMHQ